MSFPVRMRCRETRESYEALRLRVRIVASHSPEFDVLFADVGIQAFGEFDVEGHRANDILHVGEILNSADVGHAREFVGWAVPTGTR